MGDDNLEVNVEGGIVVMVISGPGKPTQKTHLDPYSAELLANDLKAAAKIARRNG